MARKIAMERDMVILYKHNSKYLNFLNKSVKDNNRILPKEIINRLADIRKSIKLKESISILSYYFEIEESIMDSLTDNSKKFYIDSKLNTLALILFKLYEAREFNDYERGMITVLLTKQNSRELDDKYLFEWRKYIRSANLSFSKMTLSSLKNSEELLQVIDDGIRIEGEIENRRYKISVGEKVYIESWFQALNDKGEYLSKLEKALYPKLLERLKELKNREVQVIILNLLLNIIVLYSLYLLYRINKNLTEDIKKIRKVINETPNSEKVEFELKRSIAKLDSINSGRRVILFEDNSEKTEVITSILDNYNYIYDSLKSFDEVNFNSKFKEYDIAIFDINLVNSDFIEKFKEKHKKRVILVVDSEVDIDEKTIRSVDNVVYNEGDMNDFRYHFKLTIKQHREFLK